MLANAREYLGKAHVPEQLEQTCNPSVLRRQWPYIVIASVPVDQMVSVAISSREKTHILNE